MTNIIISTFSVDMFSDSILAIYVRKFCGFYTKTNQFPEEKKLWYLLMAIILDCEKWEALH